jgi:hypothetical protein
MAVAAREGDILGPSVAAGRQGGEARARMVFMDDLHDRRDLHVGRRRLRLREHRLVTSQEFEGPNLVTETDLDDATAVLGLVHHVDASNERPLFRCEGGHRFEQAVRIEEIADIAEANRHEAGTNAGRAHIEPGE